MVLGSVGLFLGARRSTVGRDEVYRPGGAEVGDLGRSPGPAVDLVQLRRVLLNMIMNALDASVGLPADQRQLIVVTGPQNTP